jgi:dolichol-phosphate mannosyltransferase
MITEVSILVPTLNEERNIKKVFKLISKALFNFKIIYEIIFIDDASTDKTCENINLLRKKNKNIYLINSKERKGLGNAINIGINKSKGIYILCLDCDCAINYRELIRIIKNRSKNRVVIGSRYLKRSKIVGCSTIKIFLSKIVNKFIGYLYKIPAKDLTQSLRIFYKNRKFKPKNLTHPGFFIEMSIFFNKEKKEFLEIPVIYRQRKYEKTKNNTIKLLKSTIIFFFKIFFGNKL